MRAIAIYDCGSTELSYEFFEGNEQPNYKKTLVPEIAAGSQHQVAAILMQPEPPTVQLVIVRQLGQAENFYNVLSVAPIDCFQLVFEKEDDAFATKFVSDPTGWRNHRPHLAISKYRGSDIIAALRDADAAAMDSKQLASLLGG